MSDKPNILFWDIETSRITITAKTFSLYNTPKYFSHKDIVEDWRILCICWKWADQKIIKNVSCFDDGDPYSDRNVVETFHNIISKADVLIGHNSIKFDMKKFNAKVIEYGLPPLPPILQLDTLKEYKKVATATSHRLDYLGKTLVGDQKMETESGLWERCERGDKKAMNKMVAYCKQDVKVLEDVYNHIKPYIKGHPALHFDGMCCPKCGSHDLKKHKPRQMASGIVRQQYQCGSCGSYHTPRVDGIVKRSMLK